MFQRGSHLLSVLCLLVLSVGCAELAVLLEPPAGGGGGSSQGGASTGSTAPVLTLPGSFHQATAGRPVKRVIFRPPPGDYRQIRLEVSVTHGGWARARPEGTHNIFWLARERNRDLFGYVNLRKRQEVFMRYGIGMPQGQKERVAGRGAFRADETYRFIYLYDAAGGTVELEVRRGRELIRRLSGRADQRRVRVRQGQRFLVDFGFAGRSNANEPASVGWIWKDLRVEVR